MEKNQRGRSYRKLQVTSILFGVFGLASFLASKFTNGRLIVILTVAGLVGFLITAAVLAVQRSNVSGRRWVCWRWICFWRLRGPTC